MKRGELYKEFEKKQKMFSLYRHIQRNWIPLTSQLKRIPQRRLLSEQKVERPDIFDKQSKPKERGQGKGPVSWVSFIKKY